MTNGREDLALHLTIDPDVSAVDDALADMATQVDSIANDGMKATEDSLKHQEQQIEHINKLLGPRSDLLAKQLHLQNKMADAQLRLREHHANKTDSSKEAGRDLSNQLIEQREIQARLLAMQDPALAADRARLDSAKSTTAEMEHQQALAELRAQLDPKTITESIRRTRELEEAQKRVNDAKAKEEYEQNRPGFFERLLADPVKTVSDGMRNITNMLSPEGGGMGGMADKLAQTFKGGVGEGVGDLWSKFKEKPVTEAAPTKPMPVEVEVPKGPTVNPIQTVTAAPAGSPATGSTAITQQVPTATAAPVEGAAAAGGEMAGAAEAGGAAAGGMGGMAAAAGPIGLAVVAVGLVAKGLGKLGGMASQVVAGGLDKVSKSLSGLQDQLGPISVGFDAAGGAIQGVSDGLKKIPIFGDVVGPFLDGLALIPGKFKEITETLTTFAGKASPGTIKMFQFAVEDVQGVIGQRFVPILNLMREGVRLFGDVLMTILPSGEQVNQAMSGLRDAMGEVRSAISELVAEIGPTIKDTLIRGFKAAADTIAMYASAFARMMRIISTSIQVVRNFGEVLGFLEPRGPDELESSSGAAARPVQMQGIAEYQRSLQVASFAEPGALNQSVPNQQLSHLQIISQWTQQFTIPNLIAQLRGLVPSPPDIHQVEQAVKKAAGAGGGLLQAAANPGGLALNWLLNR